MQPAPVNRIWRASSRVPAWCLILSLAFILIYPLWAADDPFPDGPGKTILLRACTQCHTADPIASLHRTKDEWKDTLDAMKGYGADATDEEFGILLDYLVKNFGKQ